MNKNGTGETMKSIRLKFFVGIDVCKEHLDVFIQKQDGKGELKRRATSVGWVKILSKGWPV